ncbi:MAG: selenium-dependent molybdenum cofactor biosynthesis protein YqeB [Syntrophobacteraceae bacterium]|nr:selenium-dependent molybdenum cofactor biosynthesis protein YqeB [Syntrophobacteraceae bacterium]
MTRISVCIKGAGEMASAVAWRLFMVNIRNIVMLEVPQPLAVRRGVSFCEAVYDGSQTVEGVGAVRVKSPVSIAEAWKQGKIGVAVDPGWDLERLLRPDVVVDAILAKENLGSSISEAPLVIALGPGFRAGCDAHFVIETNRGHDLGRVISDGCAAPDTGIPGEVSGYTEERVLRAPAAGIFRPDREIGDRIERGQSVGRIGGVKVEARIDGVLRGLIRPGAGVCEGLKIGDIDPRGDGVSCVTISDKARAVAGSVLEAILRVYMAPGRLAP